MDKELMAKVLDVEVSIRGIERLLEAAACFPTTDASALLDMLGGIQKLAKSAGEELNEVFNYIMFMDETKEAPAPEATGTSAEIKKDHIEVSTITPKPSTEIYQEVVEMLKKQIPAEDIAYKTRVPITQVYKIKGDIS